MRFLKCSFFLFVVSLANHAAAAPEGSGNLCQFLLSGPVDPASMLPSFGPALHEMFPFDLLYRDYSSFPFVVPQRMDAVSLRALTPTPDEQQKVAALVEKASRSAGPLAGVSDYEEAVRLIAERARPKGARRSDVTAISPFEQLQEYEQKFHRESPGNARFVYRWKDVRFAVEGLRMHNVTVRESPITLLPREMQIAILDRVLVQLEKEAEADRRAQLMLPRVRFLRQQAENTPFTLAEGAAAALAPHEPSAEEPGLLSATLGLSAGPQDVSVVMREEIRHGLQPENPAARAMFEEFLEEIVMPLGKMTAEEYFSLLNSMIEIRADFSGFSTAPSRSTVHN